MTAHQRHLFGIGLIQGGIVNDQNTFGLYNKLFGLLPKRLAVWWYTLEQTCVGVMRRCGFFTRNNFRSFYCAKNSLRRYQELDVIVFVDFSRVHALNLITLYQLRKS